MKTGKKEEKLIFGLCQQLNQSVKIFCQFQDTRKKFGEKKKKRTKMDNSIHQPGLTSMPDFCEISHTS